MICNEYLIMYFFFFFFNDRLRQLVSMQDSVRALLRNIPLPKSEA